MDEYVMLQRLTEPRRSELATTFHRVGEILAKAALRKPAQLHFSIVDNESGEPLVWSVAVAKGTSKVVQKRTERADVEIITTRDTWWQIADGRLSPLDAFVKGLLRVRGDLNLAKRVFLVELAAGPCEIPSWAR